MAMVPGTDKKAFITHIDDHEWEEVFPGFRIKKLISETTVGKSEYYAGVAELDPGVDTPIQSANLACCTYLLDGQIWARLGRQRLELEAEASNYIPVGAPFAYEASGDKGLRFLFAYATDNETGEHLKFEPVAKEEALKFYQPNCPSNLMSPGMEAEGYRWACAGDADPYIMVEAAQGSRSLSFQAYYDEDRGCKEMWWGRTYLKSNCRYTPHYHEQSEFFYFLTGTGTMYAGNEIVEVRPGSMVYCPSNCLHGMVNNGVEPLQAIYCCNVEKTGNAYIRYEVADVPLVVPIDRTNRMLSEFE